MSSILTPGLRGSKGKKSDGNFYGNGSDKYASSIAEVKKIFGPNAITKAREIVKEFASDDTKRLLSSSDLGNFPATIHRVLDFADKAEAKRNEAIQDSENTNFYKPNKNMLNDKFRQVEIGIRDEFTKVINVEARQDIIDREGPLEMV